MYEFGKIVLVPFPFTDLTSAKLRPALIVSKKADEDLILVFISSKIAQFKDDEYAFLLQSGEKEFKKTGLKVDSVIRLNKIATINKRVILGEIGKLSETTIKKAGSKFHSVFGF